MQPGMPPRKEWMTRGPGPARTPFKRTSGLSRAVPQSTARRRDTGFSPKVKLQARTRAGGGDPANARCEAGGEFLGLHGGEVQHRIARGMGGCTDEVVNGISNAALLCGNALDKATCHGKCEDRDPEMEAKGWWIRKGNGPRHDPRFIPVMVMSESGSGALQYLTADGGYSSAPPSEVAA